jgi:hypothetical protein
MKSTSADTFQINATSVYVRLHKGGFHSYENINSIYVSHLYGIPSFEEAQFIQFALPNHKNVVERTLKKLQFIPVSEEAYLMPLLLPPTIKAHKLSTYLIYGH